MESDENGDVVTLRSDGEIAATYYYDAFGNVLSKTGEADNSILYAGYQYDEETGLYYVNARMYDPVTARFLQADTYLGNINDPLSLNLYTYCLNNPDRYVDPSGHSAVLTILGFVAARVIIGLAAGIVSAGMEVFNQKVLEKRTRVNYDLVLFEGISNGIIAMTTSAVAAIGKNAAKQTAKVTARKIGRKLLQGVALGAAEGMAMDVGRQIIEGTKIKDVSFTQALGSGVTGGIFGAVGVGMEFGLDALKKTRGFVKLQSKAKTTISKGANAIKVKFAELADGNNRGILNWNAFKKDTAEALGEVVEGGYRKSDVVTSKSGKGTRLASQIEGNSYDINKLQKTQSYTYPENVASMKESIIKNGPSAVPPIEIRVHNGQALVVDGHHRLEAFRQLGYERVPIKYLHGSQLGKTLPDGTYYRPIHELLDAVKLFN